MEPIARTLAFKPSERNVFFHLLTGCNLSCRHCYINPEQHGKGMVSRETMRAWLALFFDRERETNLVFLGGEPTLHPDLAEGIAFARQLGYHSVTVDTNGYLFHDLLDRVSPRDAVLSFSLDGPSPAVNDPIRGEGVFAVCTGNLRRAVAKGFAVSVIYTVSRLNLEHLREMPRLLADWGVHRFFIQVIGIRGKPAASEGDRFQLSPEEWLAVVPEVAWEAARMGLHVVYPKVFLEEGERFECAGRVAENYFIFPNGRVYCCPLCEDFPVHTYRIEEGRLVKNSGLIEERFFGLDIPEGCVMNKLLQPGNLRYNAEGRPLYRISCCLLKQEVR
ncbi:MAG: radical SAM protein [Desulfobacteraceae bacterium]|nr:radical SAM protein [Desulfobacteraceae bacterium]